MRAEVLVMAGKKEMLWLLAHKLRYLLTFRLAASLSGASGVSGCERVPLRWGLAELLPCLSWVMLTSITKWRLLAESDRYRS